MEVVYKTVCHSPCSVEGVQTESRPNPGMKECYVFQTRDNHCKVCGCSWEEHIHRRYKLDKVVKRILDPAVESMLKNCTSEKEAAELFLENEKERVWTYLWTLAKDLFRERTWNALQSLL